MDKVKIGQKVKIKGGKRLPKGREVVDYRTDYPYIRVKDLEFDRLNSSDIKYITYDIYERIKNYVIFDNEIYISIAGTIGIVGKIPSFLNGANLTENCAKFTEFSEDLDSTYLMYYLRSNEGQGQISGKTGGASQPKLAITRIAEIEIPYHKIETQRKIASILSAYDDLIENNLKRIKLLEEKLAIAYSTEFGNYQVSNKEFTSLPKGWSVKTIGEIYGKLESGSRPKGGIDKELKEGIASVGAENVIGLGKYNYQSEKLITLAFFENMNRGIIEDRDILIYKDGAYIGKTTLFQDGFPHEKCCVNEHVFLLTSKDIRYQYFLFFTLNQRLYFEKMQQLNANAAQPGINQESLKSLKLIWPSEDKIEKFNKEVETSVKLIFVLAKQNTKLREARDILLPKLMSGEIEV